ncbi:MAG TPA: hypothetical protein VF614_08260 [Chthoniobacteraceae bacterium]
MLQGAPATTLDTDIWVDLPERQYVRLLTICKKQGAEILARTVVALSDDSLVNFLLRVDGLKSFAEEAKRAVKVKWLGTTVLVLPLASLIKSKEFLLREKDIAHLPLLRTTLKLLQANKKN